MSSPAGADELDGMRLADALRAGIYRLFRHSDHINHINVFPVADGDTGTNLSMTLSSVLTALDRDSITHAGQVLTRVADAALDGARGNSGAILAQFLLGMGDKVAGLARLSTRDFAAAVAAGAAYAREALSQPREGTLLTVLSDFARETARLAGAAGLVDFSALFAAAMLNVRRSLAATQNQLEELRAAGVVDAGAMGLVEVLEGMTSYLQTGDIAKSAAPVHDAEEPMAVGNTASDYRYCVECMITGDDMPPRKIRENFASLGGSLVVGGTQRKMRVHIHSNNPQQVFELAAGYGAVSCQKADDMLQQQAAAHHAVGQQVVVVTDSAADIPELELERLGLHLIPVRVHFGNHSYLDKVSLSPAQFYRELASNPQHPKTSQPPPGDFRRMYEFLSAHYSAVVSISVTSKVSGTFNAAVSAAARVDGKRVTVLDSGNVSLGQGLIAIRAAEAAQRGASAQQVIAAAKATIQRCVTFALLSNLDYAVRGGRVPRAMKLFADMLRFATILRSHADGRFAPGGVIVGRFHLRDRFARWILRQLKPDGRYRMIVGHGNCEPEAVALLTELQRLRPDIEFLDLLQVGTALGVHGGPDMLVVGVERCEQRPTQ
jgi:DegV family protein with EDD domain